MKRIALLLFLVAGTLHADELTKNVQTELKDLGFFYGEVTGVNGPETAAAVKRYQIRNGQEVTGTFTKDTLQGLGLLPDTQAAPAPTPQPSTPQATVPPVPTVAPARPPMDLRRDRPDPDASYLQRTPPPGRRSGDDPAVVPPPARIIPPPAPGMDGYTQIFALTPYETAPAEVQVSTFRKAQSLLAKFGYFRGPLDGRPGPDSEEAILRYQRHHRLPLTGRLDIDTLGAMALLPGRSNGPALRPFTVPPGSTQGTRVYRGVRVD